MLIHEPLELLAIPGVAEIFHEFREFALGGDELLAFFFQPREFSGAPFVEGAISGRAHAKTGGALYRIAQAFGIARPVRPVSPFFSPEGNNVAGVTGFLLPERLKEAKRYWVARPRYGYGFLVVDGCATRYSLASEQESWSACLNGFLGLMSGAVCQGKRSRQSDASWPMISNGCAR
jgi:hypothetical protein